MENDGKREGGPFVRWMFDYVDDMKPRVIAVSYDARQSDIFELKRRTITSIGETKTCQRFYSSFFLSEFNASRILDVFSNGRFEWFKDRWRALTKPNLAEHLDAIAKWSCNGSDEVFVDMVLRAATDVVA